MKIWGWDFPGGLGDMGLIPGQGRPCIPRGDTAHAPSELSLWATTTEACVPIACALQQDKLQQREARAPYEDAAYRPT